MQDQNKQSLFDWKIVPITSPRPQKFIDLDIADNRQMHSKQAVDYTITTRQKRQAAETNRLARLAETLPQKEDPAV